MLLLSEGYKNIPKEQCYICNIVWWDCIVQFIYIYIYVCYRKHPHHAPSQLFSASIGHQIAKGQTWVRKEVKL